MVCSEPPASAAADSPSAGALLLLLQAVSINPDNATDNSAHLLFDFSAVVIVLS